MVIGYLVDVLFIYNTLFSLHYSSNTVVYVTVSVQLKRGMIHYKEGATVRYLVRIG